VHHHQALQREADARLGRWLGAAKRAEKHGWTEVLDFAAIPAQARAESYFWCDQVFTPEARPHDAPGVKHAHHRARRGTIDLLRHAYAACGMGIVVVEGRNFLLVRIDRRSLDVLALPEDQRAPAIRRAAAALFRAPPGGCTPTFELPQKVVEGTRFCSDEGADPLLLRCWAERVEGGIEGGELRFVVYKKAPQRVGFGNARGWLG
jgi:hypothetical protein